MNDESFNISYLNYENYGDYARMDLGTILNAGMALYIYLPIHVHVYAAEVSLIFINPNLRYLMT